MWPPRKTEAKWRTNALRDTIFSGICANWLKTALYKSSIGCDWLKEAFRKNSIAQNGIAHKNGIAQKNGIDIRNVNMAPGANAGANTRMCF